MSEEWLNGWYRAVPGQQARPSFTPRPDAEGSPYEPTQAVPSGTAWPAQPPRRSWPGDGGQDQRALLKSLLAKMTSAGTLINPFAAIPAASGAASSLTVDQGTNLTQLVSVAFALRNPVTTMVPFGGFGSSSAGSVVKWNTAEAAAFFHDLATDTPLPKNLITGASVAGTA